MASRNGWLRLGFLYFNDIPMSCQLWISANRHAYILKLFYDEKYQDLAPGKILTAELMKYVIDIDKAELIDYVHGDEAYKKDWTPKRRERKGVVVYNKNYAGQYLRFLSNSILPRINKSRYLRKSKEIIKNLFLTNS
jgi:CelD/BcsL family acetyltransferase involved in cellulose biosynthesis